MYCYFSGTLYFFIYIFSGIFSGIYIFLYIYICLKKVPKISNKFFHHLNIFGFFPSYRNFVSWTWETQVCATWLMQRALSPKDTMSFDPAGIPWYVWEVCKIQVSFPGRSFHAATLFWGIRGLNSITEALPCQSPSGPENSHWCIQVTIMQSESIGRKEVRQEDSNVTLIEFSVNVS